MRVYHFVCAKYGLQNLKEGYLKVAGFDDVNDPIEFLGVELSDKAVRRRFIRWRERAMAECGIQDWGYEKEVRRVVPLEQAIRKNGRYFWRFGDDLLLREVIVGALCNNIGLQPAAPAEIMRRRG